MAIVREIHEIRIADSIAVAYELPEIRKTKILEYSRICILLSYILIKIYKVISLKFVIINFRKRLKCNPCNTRLQNEIHTTGQIGHVGYYQRCLGYSFFIWFYRI